METEQSWREWLREYMWEAVGLFVLLVIITLILLSVAESAIGNIFEEISHS